jgi:predicted GNAT family acetyltransferase
MDVTDTGSAYEAHLDGGRAGLISYTRDGDVVTMSHTEVEPHLEGRGIGSELVQRALDDVRSKGLRVRPACPFVASYIRDHAEYGDLVSDD